MKMTLLLIYKGLRGYFRGNPKRRGRRETKGDAPQCKHIWPPAQGFNLRFDTFTAGIHAQPSAR